MKYITKQELYKLCGYKRKSSQKLVPYNLFIKKLTYNYNKRNPEVINTHSLYNIIPPYKNPYSIEALTLNPVINYLNNISLTYSLQYHVKTRYKSRFIDLFIPHFNIGIECDENNHKDRNKSDELNRKQHLSHYTMLHYNINRNEKNKAVINTVCQNILDLIKRKILCALYTLFLCKNRLKTALIDLFLKYNRKS